MKKCLILILTIIFVLGISSMAFAWEPTERIEIVVHNDPGSGNDFFARTIAKALREEIDQEVKVSNRVGGGGLVARRYMYGQLGNPHILASSTETHITNPLRNPDDILIYEFVPVGYLLGEAPLLCVSTDSEYETIDDLLDAAKEDPDEVVHAYGAPACGPWFIYKNLENYGVKFNNVSFETGGETVLAVLGGHADLVMASPPQVREHIEAGDLRPIAVGTKERMDSYPEIPTLIEKGYDVSFTGPRGFYMPPDTPEEAQKYWISMMKKIIKKDSVAEYVNNNDMVELMSMGDDMFNNYVDDFLEANLPHLREAGLVVREFELD